MSCEPIHRVRVAVLWSFPAVLYIQQYFKQWGLFCKNNKEFMLIAHQMLAYICMYVCVYVYIYMRWRQTPVFGSGQRFIPSDVSNIRKQK